MKWRRGRNPKVQICHQTAIDLILLIRALVAQRLEQRTHNPLAVGSNPTEGTISFSGLRGW